MVSRILLFPAEFEFHHEIGPLAANLEAGVLLPAGGFRKELPKPLGR